MHRLKQGATRLLIIGGMIALPTLVIAFLISLLTGNFNQLEVSTGLTPHNRDNRAPANHKVAASEVQSAPVEKRSTLMQSDDEPITPFALIVPHQDGVQATVYADGLESVGVEYVADVNFTSSANCWTFIYSNTLGLHVAPVSGFTPQISSDHTLKIIESESQLAIQEADFQRLYVANEDTPTFISDGGKFQLSIVSTDTFASEIYLTTMSEDLTPAELPDGYQQVGNFHTLRASGNVTKTTRPMELALGYTDQMLAGRDPFTLKLLRWDTAADPGRWVEAGNQSHLIEQSAFAAPVRQFTTYVLASGPSWHDDFSSFDGLDSASIAGVDVQPDETGDWALQLEPGTSDWTANSRSITPPEPYRWRHVTLRTDAMPPVTTLRINVAAEDGTVLMSDVRDGMSLAHLDVATHPALRLQANLQTSDTNETPRLYAWGISWEILLTATPTDTHTPTPTPTFTHTPTLTPMPTDTPTPTPVSAPTPEDTKLYLPIIQR